MTIANLSLFEALDLDKQFGFFSSSIDLSNDIAATSKNPSVSSQYLYKKLIVSAIGKRKDSSIRIYLDRINAFIPKHSTFPQGILDEVISGLNYSSLEATYGIRSYAISLNDFDNPEKQNLFLSSFTKLVVSRFNGIDRITFVRDLIDEELFKQDSISAMLNLYLLLLFASKVNLSTFPTVALQWDDQKTDFILPLLNETALKLLMIRNHINSRWTPDANGRRYISIGMIFEKFFYFSREETLTEFYDEIPELIQLVTMLKVV